jgi:DNA-directed RNA polymerase subunit RPC12/RpoP
MYLNYSNIETVMQEQSMLLSSIRLILFAVFFELCIIANNTLDGGQEMTFICESCQREFETELIPLKIEGGETIYLCEECESELKESLEFTHNDEEEDLEEHGLSCSII